MRESDVYGTDGHQDLPILRTRAVDDPVAQDRRLRDLVGRDHWAAMFARKDRFGGAGPSSEVWIRNTRFLDDAIARGSQIRLASNPLDPLNQESTFLREIEYLRERGAL